jgi:thioredoxin reductase (NADPH)
MQRSQIAKVVSDFSKKHNVAIFSKSWCPFCAKVKSLFDSHNVPYGAYELDKIPEADCEMIQDHLKEVTGIRSVPNVWVNGNFAGDSSKMTELAEARTLFKMINNHDFDYDVVVIGGGSGGLAASKKASAFGRKVAVLDFVKPTPVGTQWGLGGTCVNVGCIPKKLMHTAALQHEAQKDSVNYGWEYTKGAPTHNWETMVQNVGDYIGGLNWGYRVELRDNKVEYINGYGSLVDKNTVKSVDRKGREKMITAEKIIIAVGERPKYPANIPNVQEYTITSDDLFSLPYSPGKTLIIGASYVALECAGFLNGIGIDTTVMVRSIFLRGFDQQMADIVGKHLEADGVKYQRPCTLQSIEKLTDSDGTAPGSYKVTGSNGWSEEFNTIVYAIGREANLESLNLDAVGVENKWNKIVVNEFEQTSVDNIYSLGDCTQGVPELTPAAIQGGEQLIERLYSTRKNPTDYVNIPTTVFTPLEYSACGYSEEDAIKKFGEDGILTYHRNVWPLEWTVPGKPNDTCYMKMIVEKATNVVVGLHYAGPNAGELMQGFAVAMKMKATKDVFDETVGIHPTNAEWFTGMKVTKQSGAELTNTGC